MTRSIVLFAESTVALLAFAILGVCGCIEDVEITNAGYLASTEIQSMAFGGIGYYWRQPHAAEMSRDHEYGHLCHEDQLDVLYLPIAATTSLIGRLLHLRDYYGLWTERMADELGEVRR